MVTKKIFSFVLMITILLGCCSARIYKVGDSSGWTTKKDAFDSWVKYKVFYVGDSLLFKYNRNINDVTQVSNALDYQSCNTSSAKALYNTGHDFVTLTEPGYHFFISSNHNQCVSGLKLNVSVVVYDPSRIVPPPPPPPPSQTLEPSRPTPQPSPPSKNLPSGKLYKVGNSRGWGVYNSYYYYKWSEDRKFYVGDTLYFQYNKDLNDVEEISDELEFKSCEPTSTNTIAVYKTGHDFIKLTKPGVHYFVSLKTGLCVAGIKLRVTVLPLTEAVTTPSVPKMKLSPFYRRNRWWLRPFRPHH